MRSVAGQPATFFGDDGPAISAGFFAPRGLAFDSKGNLYVVDSRNRRVRVISLTSGVVRTFAGTGEEGITGDGGPAVRAEFGVLNRVAVDAKDNVYISGDHRIRRITRDGVIDTIAGNGLQGFSGDGGPATQAELNDPEGMAFGGDGSLYVADRRNDRIRRIAPDGTITTVAGASVPYLPPAPQAGIGDGGPAASAILFAPAAVAIDRTGRLYIADSGNRRIRRLDLDGTIHTIAGGGKTNPNGPVAALDALLPAPLSLALDASGNVYFTTFGPMYELGTDGNITPVSLGSGVSVLDDLTFDAAGNLYFSQVDRSQVIQRSADGTLTTFAGTLATGFGGDGGPALGALLYLTYSVATDHNGNVYFGDVGTRRVRKITPDGMIQTIAGADGTSLVTDGVPALSVPVLANALAVDAAGNVFVVDGPANRVYKVTPDGLIRFFAGNGQRGAASDNSGEGMAATQVALSGISDIALDSAGNLYLAEFGRKALRRVVPDGTIHTLASDAYAFTAATAITMDRQGNLYAVDFTSSGPRIVRISNQSASVLATLQPSLSLGGLAVDAGGNVYFAEIFTHRIRRVSPDGAVKTIAGMAYQDGFGGDGGLASAAHISQPIRLAAGDDGTVYFADIGSDRVRAISNASTCAGVSVPVFLAANVTNLASSFARGAVAPGEPIRITGLDFGPSTQVQAPLTDGSLPASLAGTRVMIDGVPAPIIAVSSGQAIAIAPASFRANATQITVEYAGQASDPVIIPVEPAMPALFAASGGLNAIVNGQAAALNQDGTVNGARNPAAEGSVIALFGAGCGMTIPPGLPGTLAPMLPGMLSQPATATIGGKAAEVLYAGPAPGLLSGVCQVNARIPTGVSDPSGVLVSVTIGAITSPLGVTLSVR